MIWPGKMKYTLDTSVILKWFSQEDEKDLGKAMQVREDYQKRKIDLLAPELLIYETANVLRYKKSIEEELICKAILSIYAMDILFPVNQLIMENAVKSARMYDITVYDSAYLSFAQITGTNLITADKKLYKKIKDLPGIIIINEY